MPDLIEWFREQLDQDEAAVRDTIDIASLYGEGWDTEWRWVLLSKPKRFRDGWSSTVHPGAPSPAAVLADIAAKREIIEWIGVHDFDRAGSDWGILCALAKTYADRPGFDPAWRTG